MGECYFLSKKIPTQAKLTKELIKLNFEKYVPFKVAQVLHYKVDSEQYYLYFTQKTYKEPIVIPESYIVSLALKQDGIYIFDTKPKKVFVVMQGIMQEALEIDDQESLQIALLQDQYAIETPFCKSKGQYLSLYQKGLSLLQPQRLLSFWQLEFSKEKTTTFVVEKLTYPIVFFIALYIGVSYTQSYLMEQNIKKLTNQFEKLKQQNSSTKEQIRAYNNKVRALQDFVQKTLQTPDPFVILDALYKVITPKDKAKLTLFSFDNSGVQIRIQTKEDAIKYLNRLNNIEFFKSVVIQSSYTNRRTKEKTYVFAITLKDSDGK